MTIGILSHLVSPPRPLIQEQSFDEAMAADPLLRLMVLGMWYEAEKKAQAWEADTCQQLYWELESEYMPFLVERETKHPRTIQIYGDCAREFVDWCKVMGLASRSAKTTTVALFLDSQIKVGRPASAIRNYAAAIRYWHCIGQIEADPTSDPWSRASCLVRPNKQNANRRRERSDGLRQTETNHKARHAENAPRPRSRRKAGEKPHEAARSRGSGG
jgi:hypothetical protein